MSRLRVWARRRTRGGEDGAVAVLVGLLAVVLFGFAAFAVDLGSAWALRRKAQTAADAAALAGAQVIGGGNPVTTAGTYATSNGFTGATVNHPPLSGSNIGNPSCVEVVVNQTVNTVFAGTMGIPTMTIGARAVACKSATTGGGYAIFANSTTCDPALDWPGNETDVTGGVHSNRNLKMGGNNNGVTGPTTYRTTFEAGGSNNTFNPAAQPNPTAKALPVNFNIADYAPGGTKASLATSQGRYFNAGNDKIDTGWLQSTGRYNPTTGVITPGLYYTTGDIDFSNNDMQGLGVTFVTSAGKISLSGNNHIFTPWDTAGLVLFTNRVGSCAQSGVTFNGNGHQYTGIVFAPRGHIEMSGNVASTVNGSLIADTVKLNGNGMNITFNDAFGAITEVLELSE